MLLYFSSSTAFFGPKIHILLLAITIYLQILANTDFSW